MSPLVRLFRGLRAAFSNAAVLSLIGFTATLIACAAVFYHYVEGWGFLDAAYFAVMTISTVGYGDFSSQAMPGKVFTIGYVLVGLGVFVSAASAIASELINASNATSDRERGK